KIEFLTPVLVDCFNHDQPFPDDIEILLKFHQNSIEWIINGMADEDMRYEITVNSAKLLVTTLTLAPGVNLYRALGGTIVYKFPVYIPKHYVLPGNITKINEELWEN